MIMCVDDHRGCYVCATIRCEGIGRHHHAGMVDMQRGNTNKPTLDLDGGSGNNNRNDDSDNDGYP